MDLKEHLISARDGHHDCWDFGEKGEPSLFGTRIENIIEFCYMEIKYM